MFISIYFVIVYHDIAYETMQAMHAADMSIELTIQSDPNPGKHPKQCFVFFSEPTSLLDIHVQLLLFVSPT